MNLEFSREMWFWKGPAPWHFITVPEEACEELEATSALVSYGWGMIPVKAQIGRTRWKTSLFPKDGRYIVPVKASVRKAEGIEAGDMVTVRLAVDIWQSASQRVHRARPRARQPDGAAISQTWRARMSVMDSGDVAGRARQRELVRRGYDTISLAYRADGCDARTSASSAGDFSVPPAGWPSSLACFGPAPGWWTWAAGRGYRRPASWPVTDCR